tara:strand:- start:5 stop:631 length:627 start_codon:yes stop_codon:yes gene_type:complete
MKKIDVSLTEFIDFIMKSGPAKMTKVNKVIKMRSTDYAPFMDFYKPIRDKIIEMHEGDQNKEVLNELIESLTDEKKQSNYPRLVKGYQRFLGRKEVKWFKPPTAAWEDDLLKVAINPELGLEIKGDPTIIKLYFKQEPLDKYHADMILTLMRDTLVDDEALYSQFAVLDVGRGKLYTSDKLKKDYKSLIEGEAKSFSTIWMDLISKAA